MSRRHVTFAWCGDTLVGTLDAAEGTSGLLLVTGGSEPRGGAFAGQAEIAARLAVAGHPVFRFDRRGVGDSTGNNRGFRESAEDIEAALATFRAAMPQLQRVIGFGNCDAASALMLGSGAGLHGLVLANPWTLEDAPDSPPPPVVVRVRYAEKLRNPHEWARLVSGQVSFAKLARGLRQALRPAPPPSSLAEEIARGLSAFTGPAQILLAGRDRTTQAFLTGWDASDPRLAHCPGASHGFVEPDARDWLYERLLDALMV